MDFWAQNIFDEEYAITVFDAPLQGEGTGRGSTQTFSAYLGDPQESLPGSDSFDLDCAFQVTRARKVEGQLHAEPRFRG